MNTSKILFEPAPMARIGVLLDTKEVIAVSDFSSFAFMLEEFISLGVTSIAVPESAPEVSRLDQMPKLLKKRVLVLDDSNEREDIARLLYPIRHEFKAEYDPETNQLICLKELHVDIKHNLELIHQDLLRLALGFNHNLQIEIDSKAFIRTNRSLRKQLNNSISRVLLSQLEALLTKYKDVSFDSPVPTTATPKELIVIFDKLINDPTYLELSDAITKLSMPDKWEKALVTLRDCGREIVKRSLASTAWDYTAKLIKAWSGIPLPESKDIASLVLDKSFPQLINLNTARDRAAELWATSDDARVPLRRDGLPVSDEKIRWIQPMKGGRAYPSRDFTIHLGKVEEFIKMLDYVLNKTSDND